ncbi:Carbamoyl-phosphate synthase large chain [hydrothermal vent metagenome]|uniref:Ammonium-dependent carbamoyl phosphate synthetase n=1 Tax=hydrothermal vent metagenome TaxID=652676 RepID=A0A3B0T1T3_9ZZZZ
MPKREDISSILIIGAGPIVIGQACEFDYSGVQACKALREEGYRVILVNSNPATIMTDPQMADATYIEPITPQIVAKIIAKERPDALLPTMGGQTALNTALSLNANGTLAKYGVELIGAQAHVIDKAEDRELFRAAMQKIGLETPDSRLAHNMDEAETAFAAIGLPAIIRPSFTLGGTGGGIAYNKQEFRQIVASGIEASPTNEVLIEQSIVGWKEFEMEVVRDRADNCIIVCSIENIDPMGVHTGDSITVAPALTLTDREYQMMRNASIAVLREIGVETGGSNVQFAVNPKDGRLVVIEMNPRVSRSSALASKATGFPIARIATKLAIGYTLDELENDITGATPASFEPSIDYVVTKIPRFAFEKYPGAEAVLSTAMKSVGEAMAIGRTFAESMQKALRSLETGLAGFDEYSFSGLGEGDDTGAICAELAKATPQRLLAIAQAFRHGLSLAEIQAVTLYEAWFLQQIEQIIHAEATIRQTGLPTTKEAWLQIKQMGFSDARLAQLCGLDERQVRAARNKANVHPVYKRIDTCAAEFRAKTPYMYSTYEAAPFGETAECEAQVSDKKKVIILGGGPNRIGQGIEFDYCCCHAAFALEEIGIQSIMVNCNPETVSTDYDTSDRLYFEPLSDEDVLEICRLEMSKGELLGVIVQFGGQTPLKLAGALQAAGVPLLGTCLDSLDLAEDRERFKAFLDELNLTQPPNIIAKTEAETLQAAEQLGYPLVLRPSHVLGGRGMEIITNTENLKRYVREAVQVSAGSPLLLDRYVNDAIEVDVDAICDGTDVWVCGIMEHIEEAGVHSGDSACALPPFSLSDSLIEELRAQSRQMALALHIRGLMNVQFAISGEIIYVLEVNPRASRTVPFVAKAIGAPVAAMATRVMAGEKLADMHCPAMSSTHVAVKEAVFPFARFAGVDPVLGPEMRSTGEVMGLDTGFARAFAKSQLAGGVVLPEQGNVFISVKDSDKQAMIPLAQNLQKMGFGILATGGTATCLADAGVKVIPVNKVHEGRPHCVDTMKNDQISLVFNTTQGRRAHEDSYAIRRTALEMHIPYFTTAAAAAATVRAIKEMRESELSVRALQDFSWDDSEIIAK